MSQNIVNDTPPNYKNIVTLNDTNNPASEAFRSLRTNLMFKDYDEPVQVVNFTSASKEEGKTTTAINLAITYTQLGKKVLLIDLDLRVPSLHKEFNLRNFAGITNLISKSAKKDEVIQHVLPNLDVITSGSKIVYHSEFVQSNALQQFILKCRKEYDFIVLDCPPIGLVTDALIVSRYTDGTILVAEYNRNDKTTLRRMRSIVEEVGCKILGVVITKAPLNKKYYAYYNYRYQETSNKKTFNPFKRNK